GTSATGTRSIGGEVACGAPVASISVATEPFPVKATVQTEPARMAGNTVSASANGRLVGAPGVHMVTWRAAANTTDEPRTAIETVPPAVGGATPATLSLWLASTSNTCTVPVPQSTVTSRAPVGSSR